MRLHLKVKRRSPLLVGTMSTSPCCNPTTDLTATCIHHITTSRWKPHQPLDQTHLGSLTTIPSHCYNITFPLIIRIANHLFSHRRPSKMPPEICCITPSTRSLSPTPTEPARPALTTLDGIFALAALPEDHPHTLKFPDRRPPKANKSLIRSPSFANKFNLKGQLRRRATVKSLKAEVYDGDARLVTSEEVVARLEGVGSLPPTLRLRKA